MKAHGMFKKPCSDLLIEINFFNMAPMMVKSHKALKNKRYVDDRK